MPAEMDFIAAAAVVLFAAALVMAVRTLWGVAASAKNHMDLIKRELTGWDDPATGENHPSLRAEVKHLSNRLDAVEQDTKQLRRNGGSHLADRVADIVEEIATVKDSVNSVRERIEQVHPDAPKPRRRRTTKKEETE